MGTVVGAALLLPMWVDRTATGLVASFTLEGVPDPAWWSLVNWSNFRFFLFPPAPEDYNWYGGYLGLSLVALALAGLLTGGGRLRTDTLPACVCLVAGLILALAYSTPFVQSLPGIFLLAGGRYLLFATLFLAIATGHGVHALQVTQRSRTRRVATLALGLMAIDLGPTTFQQPYARPSDWGADSFLRRGLDDLRDAAAAFVTRGEVPDHRTFFAHGETNRYLAACMLYGQARMPVPDGPHPGELAAVFSFVRPFERYVSWWVQQNLPEDDDELDRNILDGLRLLNVRYLLWLPEGLRLATMELPHPTPVLVAGLIEPFGHFLAGKPEIEQLAQSQASERVTRIVRVLALVRGMGVDPALAACRAIFVRGLTEPRDLGTTPHVEVLRHTVTESRVELDIVLSEPGFARLAYGYWPHTEVFVDGVAVDPLETEGRFTALQLDAGPHMVVLQPRLSVLRQVLLWLAVAVVLVTAWCFRRARHLSSTHRPDPA